MKGKKILALVLTGVLALGMTGCGSNSAQTAPASTTAAENAPAEESKAADNTGGEQVTLRMAWWGSQQRHDATQAVIKMYEEQNPNVKVVAVEPASSPVLSQGKSGAHKIQGIGAGFVPDVLNTKIYDEVIPVENDDAFATGKKVGHSEGVLVGISSGAAVWAGIQLAKLPENKGKTIVVLLPDTGDRYLSTPLFAD